MHNANLKLGKSPGNALVAIHQVLVVGHGLAFLDKRIHDVHLPSQFNLVAQKAKHFKAIGIEAVHRDDGLAARGQLIDNGYI